MPDKLGKFYRYRKLYSREIRNLPEFRHIVEVEETNILNNIPENCNYRIIYNRFEHDCEFIDGALFIDYFEDEGDMMAYKAAVMGNKKIYTDWLARKKEQRFLAEHDYYNR